MRNGWKVYLIVFHLQKEELSVLNMNMFSQAHVDTEDIHNYE